MWGGAAEGSRELSYSSRKKTTKRAHKQPGQALLSFRVAALNAYTRASAVGRRRDAVEGGGE